MKHAFLRRLRHLALVLIAIAFIATILIATEQTFTWKEFKRCQPTVCVDVDCSQQCQSLVQKILCENTRASGEPSSKQTYDIEVDTLDEPLDPSEFDLLNEKIEHKHENTTQNGISIDEENEEKIGDSESERYREVITTQPNENGYSSGNESSATEIDTTENVTSASGTTTIEDMVSFKIDIAAELMQLSQELSGLNANKTDIIARLDNLIVRLDPTYNASTAHVTSDDDADTCGEEFMGRKFGFPLYQEGFVVSKNCTALKKHKTISKLVTIIMISNGKYLTSVLTGIRGYNRRINVIVASDDYNTTINTVANFKRVKVIGCDSADIQTPGKLWNDMVSKVKTRYVMIARDLSHFTNYSRLERLVHLLSNSSPVGVSAGATRNLTGHWKLGCHQTEIKNYFLRYSEGYKHSMKDCILCDHISGPFMAKKQVLDRTPFSTKLHSDVIFENWFLKIKNVGVLSVNCPDSMFFIQGHGDDVSLKKTMRDSWLGVALKWKVTRIFIPPDVEFMFTCEELQLTCNSWHWSEFYLIPTCCFHQVRKSFQEIDKFAKQMGMKYALDSGSQLSAVKLQSHSPWDLDGDIIYERKYFDMFQNSTDLFLKNDIHLKLQNNSQKFKIYTPDIYIEMWDVKKFSDQFLPPDLRNVPTLMNMLGVWMRGQANPGLYARNKYGPDHFRHARFYLFDNMGEWGQYKPGNWVPCPKKHHACLDRYSVDGNMQFIPHYFENLGLSWDKL